MFIPRREPKIADELLLNTRRRWIDATSSAQDFSIEERDRVLAVSGIGCYLKLAQQQLGHSTLSTTADIYTSVDEEQVAETAEAIEKAFCGRSVVEAPSISNSVN